MDSEVEVDTRLLGETAAKCMEALSNIEGAEGGKVMACGIVVCVTDKEEKGTYIRTFCSDEIAYQQMGLFQLGLSIIQSNQIFPHEDEDLDDDDA